MRSTRTPAPRTAPASTAALDRIVEPKSGEEFLAEYWEQQPLVVPRNEDGRFDDLLSVQTSSGSSARPRPRYPGLPPRQGGRADSRSRLHARHPLEPSPFTGDGGRPSRPRGVRGAERRSSSRAFIYNWPPLAEFCRDARRRARPSGAGERVLHAARLAGSGRPPRHPRRLRPPGRRREALAGLRARASSCRSATSSYKRERDGDPGEPVHDLLLRPGDVLYLPRGWLHQALTSESDSLHITVGVNVYTWIDAVRAAVDACADDVEFRRAVPDDGEPGADLLDRLAERLEPDDVLARRRTRLVRTRRPVLDGQIRQLRALDDLSSVTPLERRPTVIADLEEDDGGATLVFEGKRISFPPQAADAVTSCFEAEGSFTAEDLRGRPRRARPPRARPPARARRLPPPHASRRSTAGARHVARRTNRPSRVAGQVGRLAELGCNIDLVLGSTCGEAHRPAGFGASAADQAEIVDARQPGALANLPLRRLLGKRVAASPAIAIQGDSLREELVEERPDVRAVHPPEVEPGREGRRGCRRTGRRRRASTARPSRARLARRARRRADDRTWRSSGRASRACRRRATDDRSGRRPTRRPRGTRAKSRSSRSSCRSNSSP